MSERPRFFAYVVPENPPMREEILARTSLEIQRRQAISPAVSSEFRIDLTDRISSEEKQRIFAPVITALQETLWEHGVATPDSLVERLFIVDGETYRNIYIQEKGVDPGEKRINEIATTLSNRACFVNNEEIHTISKEKNIPYEEVLQVLGAHELLHSLSYEETWIPQNVSASQFTDLELERRSATVTRRPGLIDRTREATVIGLSRLLEGITQHLTRLVFKRMNAPIQYESFAAEVQVVEKLVTVIGIKPIFAAYFTKRGFRTLAEALELRYGRYALYREIDHLHQARRYGYDATTFRKLAKQYGRRAMLRNYPELEEQYSNNALNHIAQLIGKEGKGNVIRTIKGGESSYDKTLVFLEGQRQESKLQRLLQFLRNHLPHR